MVASSSSGPTSVRDWGSGQEEGRAEEAGLLGLCIDHFSVQEKSLKGGQENDTDERLACFLRWVGWKNSFPNDTLGSI